MTHLISDVMTEGVIAVRPDTPLTQAAQLMRDEDIGTVMVTDGGRLLGLITDRDIALRAVADGADPRVVEVADLCTTDPVCVSPEEETARAVALMRQHSVRRLPVTSGGRPVGMASLGDLAETHDPESALGEISKVSPTPDQGSAPH
ncbi:CBS domain-containing protein [Streptomyces xanthii]|uniref:CBS domain-containing protein n=1 Tax=Streptomyces xanthii TaxID=2768069 RepID=A0A7H1B1Z8_9ACTN|nr:CBS domain-containing protein [Streptomyces xanthii]QNS02753.1 CBS domain-containing protein [Streptomyces xanthii]